jgi:YidC/Oxa1 family membrane protein insertase
MNALVERYADYDEKQLTFELNFSKNKSIYTSDVLITDWSGVATEFCFATKRPAMFVNTQMKCMNPNWEKIDCTPVEIELRNKLGRAVDKEELAECDEIVKDLFARANEYEQIIDETLHDHLYNIGTAAEAGADYILQSLVAKKK